MTKENEPKLKRMLALHRPGTVLLASWLERMGIPRDLQAYYRTSGWLDSFGRGVFVRPGDRVDWRGGVYALQHEAELPIHVGGLTSLSLLGMAHYMRTDSERIWLFSPPKIALPAWFRDHQWENDVTLTASGFLPTPTGFVEHPLANFSIRIASAERAILECLYLAPSKTDLVECGNIVDGMTTLRPRMLQQLLSECRSIKVKRLFLYLASRSNHDWYRRIKRADIDLGSGDRSIVKDGVYISEFGIVIPAELARP